MLSFHLTPPVPYIEGMPPQAKHLAIALKHATTVLVNRNLRLYIVLIGAADGSIPSVPKLGPTVLPCVLGILLAPRY
jgi:hypothetical protein